MMNDLDTLRPEVREAWQRIVADEQHPEDFECVEAELLRLAGSLTARQTIDAISRAERAEAELAAALKANRDCVDHFEQMQAELATLKARMKPCARVVGGEVRVFMDSGDEGKYVAVLVVEE